MSMLWWPGYSFIWGSCDKYWAIRRHSDCNIDSPPAQQQSQRTLRSHKTLGWHGWQCILVWLLQLPESIVLHKQSYQQNQPTVLALPAHNAVLYHDHSCSSHWETQIGHLVHPNGPESFPWTQPSSPHPVLKLSCATTCVSILHLVNLLMNCQPPNKFVKIGISFIVVNLLDGCHNCMNNDLRASEQRRLRFCNRIVLKKYVSPSVETSTRDRETFEDYILIPAKLPQSEGIFPEIRAYFAIDHEQGVV